MYSTLYLALSLINYATHHDLEGDHKQFAVHYVLFRYHTEAEPASQAPEHLDLVLLITACILYHSSLREKKTTKHHHLSLFNVKSEQLHVLQLKVYIMLRCCNILFSTCFYSVLFSICTHSRTCTLLSMFMVVCQHGNCHLMNCIVLNYTGNLWFVKFDGAKEMSKCGIWEIIISFFYHQKKNLQTNLNKKNHCYI